MPLMTQSVTVTTPGVRTVDPTNGNELVAVALVQPTMAWLMQKSLIHLATQIELSAAQNTTIGMFAFLCPLSIELTSASTVTDDAGQKYVVVGQPAKRPDHRPRWRAADLRMISDMQ